MKQRTKAAITGALAAITISSPLRAETKLGIAANTFAGYHEKQGSLIGGGIVLSAENKARFNANIDIASQSTAKPTLYSYGVDVSIPLPQDMQTKLFCAKDGIIGTPGCGGWLILERGRFSFGAGAEYRTSNTISIKTSVASRLSIAFLKIKAKIMGYINTKDKDEMSGGADATIDIRLFSSVSAFGRYNYLTKGEIRGQHAGVGGVRFELDPK